MENFVQTLKLTQTNSSFETNVTTSMSKFYSLQDQASKINA